MSFFFRVLHSGDTELEQLISRCFSENVPVAQIARRQTGPALRGIVRSSIARTGSMLFKRVRRAFSRANPYGLAPLATYPGQEYDTFGAVMASHITNQRRGRRGERRAAKPAIGGGFAKLMQYRIDPDVARGTTPPIGEVNLTVGLIPERRGGPEWADAFRRWQEAGELGYAGGSQTRFLAAIRMPKSKGHVPVRPARPVISRIEQEEKPISLFERNLVERLQRRFGGFI
ncbi:MAG: hypothetical protein DDT36_01692 [Firmicutes bacterium]|nr:hypothetical protein [Bacillota bacterium]